MVDVYFDLSESPPSQYATVSVFIAVTNVLCMYDLPIRALSYLTSIAHAILWWPMYVRLTLATTRPLHMLGDSGCVFWPIFWTPQTLRDRSSDFTLDCVTFNFWTELSALFYFINLHLDRAVLWIRKCLKMLSSPLAWGYKQSVVYTTCTESVSYSTVLYVYLL